MRDGMGGNRGCGVCRTTSLSPRWGDEEVQSGMDVCVLKNKESSAAELRGVCFVCSGIGWSAVCEE